MANQSKQDQLTLAQIGQLRNTAARSTAQLISRLRKNALGELDPPMSATAVKSATACIGLVIPAMTSTQWEDVTPDMGNAEDIQQAYQAQLREHIQQTLHSMSPEEIAELMGESH